MAASSKPYPKSETQRRLSGVTPFRFKVYDALLMIPPGKVTTYGLLAKYLKTSPRAVGGALRHNPYAPFIPCHRVIAADYFVGGFSGYVLYAAAKSGLCRDLNPVHAAPWHRAWGTGETIDRKRELLLAEGVAFDSQGYLPMSTRSAQTYHFPQH
jgi:methylated-DNA-[protein]-cysteine S-methyltransferase